MMQYTSAKTMTILSYLQKTVASGALTDSHLILSSLKIIKTQTTTLEALGIQRHIPVQNRYMKGQTYTTQ